MFRKTLLFLLLAGSFLGCGTQKIVVESPAEETEYRQLDTLYVTAEPIDTNLTPEPETYSLPPYNPSAPRINDLLHTSLRVAFDWEKEQVIGQATLRLTPYFYPTNKLVLDAKGFDLKEVSIAGQALTYDYDGQQLSITLPQTYQRGEAYEVYVDYIATPAASGGSAAITSDKGLFFINPRGEEGSKPQQIWTQGETEHNSRWFPTIDKPNERSTQEIFVTVDDRFVTLSNGLLESSVEHEDGTHTDHWVMDQPHAPYLFMLAVGEFAVVQDEPWNGKPITYYVEPEYAADAEAIFSHTPEMLTFFSDLVGVEYPWPKYSQVIVRDYVSGAMENTSAVIFTDMMQMHERELIDQLMNEKFVAHEMFHHWFGDLVTCESWANLTLNEGFANYSEYLWLEHQYGRDEADFHLFQEWSGYLSASRSGIHPLINYGYDDKEDMFDTHSYNKGGSVLHMLRAVIGDDAFFAGLQRYLNDNAYSAVEVDELRMAFEDISGLDLKWFFDQWFLNEGHPDLDIDYDYDATTGEAIVNVTQQQDPDRMPAIFQLPAAVDIYLPGEEVPVRHFVMVNEREQEFRFPVPAKPELTIFDAERVLLAERNDHKTDDQLVYQMMHAPRFLDRFEALQKLKGSDHPAMNEVIDAALADDFYAIRGQGLNLMDEDNPTSNQLALLKQMAESDPHSDVRAEAISKLVEADSESAVTVAKAALGARPYNVVATALQVLAELAPEDAAQAVSALEDETNGQIVAAIGGIYAEANDPAKIDYFFQHLEDVDGYAALDFYESFEGMLLGGNESNIDKGAEALQAIAMNMGQSPWRRISATRSISNMRQTINKDARRASDPTVKEKLQARAGKLQLMIDAIKKAETNEQLLGIYRQY
ncbi:MAG: alanyl aminopeptidase [Lewinella sp.]|nr:alanyl aminopeptidase [Lewinella sp.]